MTKCRQIKERYSCREAEKHGLWMTQERMQKSGLYSTGAVKSMVSFCKKFPETLTRPGYRQLTLHASLLARVRKWQYDENVLEFYIITEDKTKLLQGEAEKSVEETQLRASWQAKLFNRFVPDLCRLT